ncbi:MAG: FAD-dependent oxidoreductase [Spirochaetales bacterium]|nr:FAD-dependent oxidoreductase [Spirochaetales bacterium]
MAKEQVEEKTADIVTYGATPGGVLAAVAAAREGNSVILIEQNSTLGGLLGSGFRMLQDLPFEEVIGGLAGEFLTKDMGIDMGIDVGIDMAIDSGVAKGGNPHCFANENRQFFTEMMQPYERKIQVIYEHRVKVVEMSEGRIVSLLLENAPPDQDGVPAVEAIPGKSLKIRGKIFIDASYEGDVMAKAGVSYRVGRESKDEYDESLAGVLGVHRFPGVSPYVKENDPKSGLLWMVDNGPLGEPGSANRFVNGYNFKFPYVKNPTPDNPGKALSLPVQDDPQMDSLLSRIGKAGYPISWPNRNDERKEIATGTIPGIQGDYPEGDWATRSQIWRTHIEHCKRLTSFTGNDVRLNTSQNGETNGWPELYLRATRRMVGRYVMTQSDIALQTQIPDAIALGFYAVDMHPARLLVLEDGTLAHEGESTILVSPGPFGLPYRFITPKTEECKNLLVPVCFSASHLAHAAIRLEAQYMLLGESAGVAAAQAIAEKKSVQEIDVNQLQNKLRSYGQKIEWDQPLFGRWRTSVFTKRYPPHILYHWQNHPEDYPVFLPEPPKDVPILVDNQDAQKIGDWDDEISIVRPFVSFGYLHDECTDKKSKSVVFNPILPFDGDYEVSISYIPASSRSKKVPVKIIHAKGENTVFVNQRVSSGGLFQSIGNFTFKKGRTSSITISTEGIDDGDLVVDAVQLKYGQELDE